LGQLQLQLQLELPFTDIRELSMDILRQGRHVEVLGPKELRETVINEFHSALMNYSDLSSNSRGVEVNR
jgi:predicted DNA-binding transcriptional regulator YafY